MPLLSDGPLIPRTPTAADLDEWAAEHYPHVPAPAAMTRADMVEALDRLAGLTDLVGPVAGEVMALLKVIIARRDHAAVLVLRFLRSLEGVAQ